GNILLAAFIARSQILRDLNLSPLQVIGSRFSADTFRIRDFFTKNRVFFSWIDIENDPNMEELFKRLNISEGDTPVVAFGNEWTRRNPTNRELAEQLGILKTLKEEVYDLAIVGAGPSGLAAAVYGASEGLSTLVLERHACLRQVSANCIRRFVPSLKRRGARAIRRRGRLLRRDANGGADVRGGARGRRGRR